MRRSRRVDIDWPELQRAFERFDPTWEDAPLPYLNLRTGRVSYFGLNQDVDFLDTLDYDQYIALSVPVDYTGERRARMRAFAAAVAEHDLSERLRQALTAARAVAGFYELLDQHPGELARWLRAESQRTQAIIDQWVQSERLICVTRAPWHDPAKPGDT